MTAPQDMIRGRSNIVTMTNNSGGALIAGDVCVQDTTADENVTTTTSAASTSKVFIAAESIGIGAAGKFYESGYCPFVNVSASATRGYFLFTHTVAKQATSASGYAAGAFGRVLKAGTTPSAIIYSQTAQISGGGVSRSGATTDNHLAVWNGSSADSIKDGGVVPAAGGRVLIAEATPSGTATASFTTIPGTYKTLILEYAARDDRAAATQDNLNIQFNADTTASHYRYVETETRSNGAGSTNLSVANSYLLTENLAATNAPASQFTIGTVTIPQYANTGFYKQALARMATVVDAATYFQISSTGAVNWANTAAITQIDLKSANGNFVAGTVFRLYGDT